MEAGVPEALAGRLARLIDHYVDAEEACARGAGASARARERAHADLARLHALLLELGRLADGAGALAADLNDGLAVSYHSDDFAEAQDAKQALAAVGALCILLRRTAADARRGRRHRPHAAGPTRHGRDQKHSFHRHGNVHCASRALLWRAVLPSCICLRGSQSRDERREDTHPTIVIWVGRVRSRCGRNCRDLW